MTNECGKSWNKVCCLEMCSEHVEVCVREGWLDSDGGEGCDRSVCSGSKSSLSSLLYVLSSGGVGSRVLGSRAFT